MGAGLVYKSELVKEAKMPLKYYVDINRVSSCFCSIAACWAQ